MLVISYLHLWYYSYRVVLVLFSYIIVLVCVRIVVDCCRIWDWS